MISFWSFIPKFLTKDSNLVNFFTRLKEYYDNYTIQIDTLQKASDIDGEFYKYIGSNFGSYFHNEMTEQEQRQSIYESITICRNPFVFNEWKPIIDRITNGNCDIYLGDVFIDPAYYDNAIYDIDSYVLGDEIPEYDLVNYSKYDIAIYDSGLYDLQTIDKGYDDTTIIYDNANTIYNGLSKNFMVKTIGNSNLPNIYIDLKIDKLQINNILLDKLENRLSFLKGSFFIINIGIIDSIAFRTYLKIL